MTEIDQRVAACDSHDFAVYWRESSDPQRRKDYWVACRRCSEQYYGDPRENKYAKYGFCTV